jgi:6-phosphogluconolactonase
MKTFRIIHALACGFIFSGLFSAFAARGENAKELMVYFGTFTKKGGKGIYFSRLDLATGKLSEPELAVETTNPGFLAIHPNHKFLYAVGELDSPADRKTSGAINAFAIDSKSGKLTFLNQQSSSGKGPAHLVVDKSGKCVLAANYGGGSVSVVPIQKDGRLGKPTASIQHTGSSVDPQRQKEPHAHSINVDPENCFAFVADLGLDKIMIYKLDPKKGTLVANEPAFVAVTPGAGPRHFAFHPNGRFAYVINEMSCTVTAFDYDAKRGALKSLQEISTLPEGQKVEPGLSTAEVQVHPSGKFLYGSNRGHDSIAVFSIDEKTGKLTSIQNESTQGKVPRNFGIDPTGKYLLAANQDSDTVVVFRIDQKSGNLEATGEKIEVPMPVCVKFLEP